jgi:bifunctional non-homologous end joining protein LigD
MADKTIKVGGRTLDLYRQDFFPEDKITKGDIVDYYCRIARIILPCMTNRPKSLYDNPSIWFKEPPRAL